jgi:hypothetical protein
MKKHRSAPLQTRNPHPLRARETQISTATPNRAAPPCAVTTGSKKPLRTTIAAATAAIHNIALYHIRKINLELK